MIIGEKKEKMEEIKKQINELELKLIEIDKEAVDFELTKSSQGALEIKDILNSNSLFSTKDGDGSELSEELNKLKEGDKILIKFSGRDEDGS